MEKEKALLVIDGEPFPAPPKTSVQTLIKFLLSALLMAVSFCFLFSPVFFAAGKGKLPVVKGGRTLGEQCDLFSGEWIPNTSGPAYSNETCNFIEAPQNCMKNGRPDNLYLHWRWKPFGCDLPPFNAEKFMNFMRGKSWGLIGDSIFRNHVQSLICLLSKVEEPVEVYHDKDYKSKTWYFPSHNFTLSTIWAPLLLKAEISENNEGRPKAPIQLHLDILERKWTSQYHNYDYIVISGGQWFLKTMIFWENDTVVGCHNCQENIEELGLEYPYRKALELALRFIVTSDHKPLVVLRTWTPSHFENGEWYNGGVCNRTLPYKEGQYSGSPTDHAMRRIEIEEFEKAEMIGSKKGLHIKLMDIFHLSLLRPDGHPGPYRTFHPFKNKGIKVQNDCLHWCLPGPIDTWNDILMEMVLNEGDPRRKDFVVIVLLAALLFFVFLLSLLLFYRVQIRRAVYSSLGWMIHTTAL